MPRGGRNAKPTHLKLIQGTYRSTRAPEDEVRPPLVDDLGDGQASSDVQHVKETIANGKVVGQETVRRRQIPVNRPKATVILCGAAGAHPVG